MTTFMICGDLLLIRVQDMTLPLRPDHHLLDRANEVILRNLFSAFARREDRSLVHERIQICTGKSGGAFSDHMQIDVFAKRFFACVNGQYLLTVRSEEHTSELQSQSN